MWDLIGRLISRLIGTGVENIADDVICGPCYQGWGQPHTCAAPDYCDCDSPTGHFIANPVRTKED